MHCKTDSANACALVCAFRALLSSLAARRRVGCVASPAKDCSIRVSPNQTKSRQTKVQSRRTSTNPQQSKFKFDERRCKQSSPVLCLAQASNKLQLLGALSARPCIVRGLPLSSRQRKAAFRSRDRRTKRRDCRLLLALRCVARATRRRKLLRDSRAPF